ncbi:alpha-2-macroglobulin family protein [Microscilla marina]|uniref:Alpha-2-macroglobulin domain-containing protein n=1 Tax=Microscilla marina ATCC 23134 TaxID=313606 RepID=A1ZFG3_MICM2|nr:alpha-2-macroglobulin family protein [Microscilla marina]EAY30737.1 hypothetical protein M23134_01061 [Microscilla marina ATCC 23134]
MKTKHFILSTALLCVVLLGAFVLLNDDQLLKQINFEAKDVTKQKAAPEKIYLHADKTLYYPGEDVWFSGYLQAIGKTDRSKVSTVAYVELLNPKGSVIKKLTRPVQGGKIAGNFALGKSWAGGVYTLRAYTQWLQNFGKVAFYEKKIQLQKVIKPQLLLQLDFKKEAYGNNDVVEATLEAKDLKYNFIAFQTIDYRVQLSGQAYQKAEVLTNAKGKALIKIKLPASLKDNDGLLNVVVSHQGKTESISRSIPIVLGNIDVQFLPEGGTCVGGIPGKMAFKALNEFGKPADIEGIVLDSKGNEVQTFASFHQGMGAFKFTPKANETYQARITRPAGIKTTYSLPTATRSGVSMQIEKHKKNSLKVHYQSTRRTPVLLVAQSNSQVYFSKTLLAETTQKTVTIQTDKVPVGISKITLYNAKQQPVCERLWFANPDKNLRVTIKTRKKSYQPREKVVADIVTTDENGQPVVANLSVAVVDDKIINLADDKQDNLLSYMLMSAEISGKVYEPSFYFNKRKPKAIPALDYVMLTHGWRSYELPKKKHKKELYNIITGKILNEKTNQATKAQVSLYELSGKQRSVKVSTGKDGRFMFANIDPTTEVQLFAKANNGQPVIITLDSRKIKRNSYNITLEENPQMLQEVVVTRYANKTSARSVGSSVQVIQRNNNTRAAARKAKRRRRKKRRKQQNKAVNTVKKKAPKKLPKISAVNNQQPISSNKNLPGSKDSILPKYYKGESLNSMRNATLVINGKVIKNKGMLKAIDPDNIQTLKTETSKIARAKYGHHISSSKVLAITTKKPVRWLKNANQANYKMSPYVAVTASTHVSAAQLNFSRVKKYQAVKYTAPQPRNVVRTDFRNTIYWNPEVITDKTGKATLTFWNNDALTSFRIIAEGVGVNQKLGRAEHTYFTKLPFELTAKIPMYFTVNDEISIPVYLTNNTDRPIVGKLVVQTPDAIRFNSTGVTTEVLPYTTRTVYLSGVTMRTLKAKENNQLRIRFANKRYPESVSETIEVFAKGFPVAQSFGGNAQNNTFKVNIPEVVNSTFKVELSAYPNALGDLIDGVASIIRRPYGCFEQVSSSTYPNIIALQFLEQTKRTAPELKEKALKYIADGYKKLAAYETSEKGFDWYGQTPPHEGLTAYGLMEFLEMQKVYNGVDPALIKRTKQWLLSRRDGQGNFKQNRGKYGFAAASQTVNNAYVVYALSFAGVTEEIEKEYRKAYKEAVKSKDAYRMALLALASVKLNKTRQTLRLQRLLKQQLASQGVGKCNTEQTIVRAGGVSRQIETSALMVLAELQQKLPDLGYVQKLINFMLSKRSGGYFGSTQGTILALKALTTYAKHQPPGQENGKLMVYRDNQLIGSATYAKKQLGKISISGLEKFLQKGAQNLSVKFGSKQQVIPFSLDINYHTYQPASNPKCALALKTTLATNTVNVNETVRLTTVVTNQQTQGVPSPMALVGIPSGLSAQPWQLKKLQEEGRFAYYELNKGYVIFYFRGIAAKASRKIHLDLKADVPGVYRAKASNAYLYYTSEYKHWQPGVHVVIKNKEVN